MNEFDSDRKGTGTYEWADVNENIVRGCSHGCLYCYAAHNANRFKTRNRIDWANEEFTKRANMTTYPAKDGVIMFPSAHDITPFSVETYIRVVKLMLNAGNRILIVSKPNLSCIIRLIEELGKFKDQILFRFTITSIDPDVSAFWEPGAPPPVERIEALKTAFDSGFRTSVSAEPLLGGTADALEIFDATKNYITDTIWFGKLNKPRTRVVMDDDAHINAVKYIECLQDDNGILYMYDLLKDEPKVRWKDSVKEVLAKHNIKFTV